ATWCDSAHNAIVYAREIDGVRHTFGVFGQLWKGSMVIYDQETMTHWSHIIGEAKRGPLKGKILSPIPALVTDWETWSRLHPEGTVAILPAGPPEYTRKTYDDPEPYLLGIASNGKSKAWNLSELQERPVINDSWEERPVLVLFDHARASACLYSRTVKNQVLT